MPKSKPPKTRKAEWNKARVLPDLLQDMIAKRIIDLLNLQVQISSHRVEENPLIGGLDLFTSIDNHKYAGFKYAKKSVAGVWLKVEDVSYEKLSAYAKEMAHALVKTLRFAPSKSKTRPKKLK